MKRIFTLLFLILGIPSVLLASTTSFSPGSVSVTPGQLITVSIYVNPQSESIYTVKAAVSFPADLLEVRSFSFSSSWLPLSQPGYDLTDNSSGTLIKTAGYGGGLSSSALFGTITFYAKKAGSGTVSMTSGTQLLNSANKNTFTGGGAFSVNVAAPVQAPPPINTPTPTPTPTPVVKTEPNPIRKPLNPKVPAPTSTKPALIETPITAASTTTEDVSAPVELNVVEPRAMPLSLELLLIGVSFFLGLFLGKKYESR